MSLSINTDPTYRRVPAPKPRELFFSVFSVSPSCLLQHFFQPTGLMAGQQTLGISEKLGGWLIDAPSVSDGRRVPRHLGGEPRCYSHLQNEMAEKFSTHTSERLFYTCVPFRMGME